MENLLFAPETAAEKAAAKLAKAAAKEAARIPVYVSGYKEHEGQVMVIFKDKVAKRKGVAPKGVEHTGTCFMVKGFTMEEVKVEFVLGTDQKDLEWGDEKDTEFGGVFEIEGL